MLTYCLKLKMVEQCYYQNVQYVSVKIRYQYKMNELVNKCLLTGDKFMPEMHLTLLGFTYSACGPFTKSKERI